MFEFKIEIGNIYRLKVPFDTVYTSVFFIDSDEKKILVDCATWQSDVDEIIIPALVSLGYSLTDIDTIVLTHKHGDHVGGLNRILELHPNINVVSDPCDLTASLFTYPLPGHTNDSIGVFDKKSGTLISGDGLQGAGVDKYRCSLENKSAYFETLHRLQDDKRFENLLFSHAYEPWNSDTAFGRSEVEKRLDECFECAQ